MVIYQRIFISALLLLGGGYISLQGMDNPAPAQVTYGCDWCQEQKPVLNSHSAAAPYSGIDCRHLLCKDCTTQLAEKYLINRDPRFYWCYRCWAFYHEKKQVCWFPIHGRSPVLASTGVGATVFKQEFGGTVRNLPRVDANTVIPANPDLQPDTNSGWLKLPSFKIKIPGTKGLFGGIGLGLVAVCLAGYVIYKQCCTDDEEDEQENNQNDTDQEGLHEIA
jgi:hypothetical protein